MFPRFPARSLLATFAMTAFLGLAPGARAQGIADQFDSALSTWNLHFSPDVTALSWATIGTLADETLRRRAVNYYVRRSYFPTGDAGDPMVVARIDSVLVPADDMDEHRATADSILAVGDSVARVRLARSDGSRFKVFVVHDDERVKFDTLFMNTEIPSGGSAETGAADTFHHEVSHLFGLTSTTFDAWVRAVNCQQPGPPSCVHDCHASPPILVKAVIRCKVRVEGRCCVLDISYAWATGLKKIVIGIDPLSLTVTGVLGRSSKGTASRVSCCP